MTQHSCDDNFVDDDFQSMTLREAVIHVSGHREASSGTVITQCHRTASSQRVIKKTRFFVEFAYICPQF
jgi:hypothetical protein